MRKIALASALTLALTLSLAVPLVHAQAQPKTHTITVKFDYDFTASHACPTKSTPRCIKQFNVYNLTKAGGRILLLSIPAPVGSEGKIRGISATTKPLLFATGEHMIGVSAVDDTGAESDPSLCTTMIKITP